MIITKDILSENRKQGEYLKYFIDRVLWVIIVKIKTCSAEVSRFIYTINLMRTKNHLVILESQFYPHHQSLLEIIPSNHDFIAYEKGSHLTQITLFLFKFNFHISIRYIYSIYKTNFRTYSYIWKQSIRQLMRYKRMSWSKTKLLCIQTVQIHQYLNILDLKPKVVKSFFD
jgi:hypothetical protein